MEVTVCFELHDCGVQDSTFNIIFISYTVSDCNVWPFCVVKKICKKGNPWLEYIFLQTWSNYQGCRKNIYAGYPPPHNSLGNRDQPRGVGECATRWIGEETAYIGKWGRGRGRGRERKQAIRQGKKGGSCDQHVCTCKGLPSLKVFISHPLFKLEGKCHTYLLLIWSTKNGIFLNLQRFQWCQNKGTTRDKNEMGVTCVSLLFVKQYIIYHPHQKREAASCISAFFQPVYITHSI